MWPYTFSISFLRYSEAALSIELGFALEVDSLWVPHYWPVIKELQTDFVLPMPLTCILFSLPQKNKRKKKRKERNQEVMTKVVGM